MPLLKGKYVAPIKPLDDVMPGEMIFTITHTGEQFRSKTDYEKRVAVYNENMWTCRLTGHINLTHEDAWKSEQEKRQLLKSFPEYCEKTVLEAVHHNTSPLDQIIDKAWTRLQQTFQPGEPVELRVKSNTDGKVIKGSIVKVDSFSEEVVVTSNSAVNSNCNSPQSDKENKNKDANATSGAANTSPGKWAPPKMLAHKYSFKLDGEDKVISGIPAEDMHREHKSPSKELLRLYIRNSAIRMSQTSPYIVDFPLIEKYKLKSKSEDLFMSPSKMLEIGEKAIEEVSKVVAANAQKRKRSSTGTKPPSKKLKLEKPTMKKTDSKSMLKGQSRLNFKPVTPKTATPKKGDDSSSSSSDSDDSDTPLAVIAQSPAKPKSPKKHATPKKVINLDSDDSDIVLSKIAQNETPSSSKKKSRGRPPGSQNKKPKKEAQSGESDAVVVGSSQENTPRKKGRGRPPGSANKKKDKKEAVDSDDSDVVLSKIVKTPEKKGRGRPAGSPNKKMTDKKKMKQMTLMDMKGKGKKSKSSPSKSPRKTPKKSPYKQPPLVLRLQRNFRSNPRSQASFQLIARCARELTKNQLANLPEDVKTAILTKHERIEEKKRLEKMSPEEKEKFMAEKREKARKKMIATQRALNKRFEDTELVDLKPLPKPKLVLTPPGLPNELFGDVAMVTEFIGCYKGLLMPDDEKLIDSDNLMKALVSGKEGFEFIGRVITILLQTLLQDAIADDYKELCMKLRDVPINVYTVCELVRLCLRKKDSDLESNTGSDDSEDSVMEDSEELEAAELVEQLESCELYELTAQEKLKIILALCHRIMGSYAIQDYMSEKQSYAGNLWKKRNQVLKIKNDRLKEAKQKRKDQSKAPKEEKEEPKEDNKLVQSSVAKFYGVKEEDMQQENNSDDLASVVKRRRVTAAKAAAERETKERHLRSEQRKLEEEDRKRYEAERLEREFEKGVLLSRLVTRQAPIGTDRFHNRYWIFHKTTPGLYMEKGWAPKDIVYRVRPQDGNASSSEDDSGSEGSGGEEEEDDDEEIVPGKRGRRPARRYKEKTDDEETENTFPEHGQNLWFMFEEEEEIKALCENLHRQGIRESHLKKKLVEQRDKLLTVIKRRSKAEEEESKQITNKENGEVEDVAMETDEKETDEKVKATDEKVKATDEDDDPMVKGFRHEMLDLELRIRHGGLGGVDDFTTYEKRLETSSEIADFAALLKETQTFLLDKFIKGELAKKEKPRVKPRVLEEGEEEEKVEEPEEIRVGINRWQEALDNCPTMSRLHILMGMLDSCIKWEKSAENAKCKICRKKGDEDRLLLCDECNQAFHLYCMRPALLQVPRGDWFCPGCAPIDRRRAARSSNFRQLAGIDDDSDADNDDDDDEENGGEVADAECIICGGDEGLAACSTCPSAFHYDCHVPPLRHAPRSSWRCQQCTSGVRIRRPKRNAPAAAAKAATAGRSRRSGGGGGGGGGGRSGSNARAQSRSTSRSARNRGFKYDDDDDDEEEDLTPRRASSRSTRNKKNYTDDAKSEDEEDDETTEEEEEEEEGNEETEEEQGGEEEVEEETEETEEESQEETELAYTSSGRPTRVRVSNGGGGGGGRASTSPKNNKQHSIKEQLTHIPDILSRLRRNRFAWPFQDPVDSVAVPDYYNIVKNPMELHSMKEKNERGEYKHPQDFLSDVALMFDNAQLYNKPDSQVGRCVAPLEKQFCDLIERFMPNLRYRRAESDDPVELADHGYC